MSPYGLKKEINGVNQPNILYRRIPKDLCCYSVLKDIEHNFSLFRWGLCIVTSLKEYSMERKKIVIYSEASQQTLPQPEN